MAGGQGLNILAGIAGATRGARSSTEIDIAERIRRAASTEAEARTLRELTARDAISDENALDAIRAQFPRASGNNLSEIIRSMGELEEVDIAEKQRQVKVGEGFSSRAEVRDIATGKRSARRDADVVEARRRDQKLREAEVVSRLVADGLDASVAVSFVRSVIGGEGEREEGEEAEEDVMVDILSSVTSSFQGAQELGDVKEALSMGIETNEDFELRYGYAPGPSLETMVEIRREELDEIAASQLSYSEQVWLKELRLRGQLNDVETARRLVSHELSDEFIQDLFAITPAVDPGFEGFTSAELSRFKTQADSMAATELELPQLLQDTLSEIQQVEYRARILAMQNDPVKYMATAQRDGGVLINQEYTDSQIQQITLIMDLKTLTDKAAVVEKNLPKYWALGIDTNRYTRAIEDQIFRVQRVR